MIKGYGYILGAATLWGMIGPFSRLAFEQGIQPMEVAFWRAILAWLFFGIHALIIRHYRIYKRDVWAIFVFGISGVTVFYGSYQIAVKNGGAALASVLLYTAPAWVSVLSKFFFKEKMTPAKLTALILTLCGIIGVSMGQPDSLTGLKVDAKAIIFGLISGFCYSLYYIFGKYFSGRYTSPNVFLYILPIGAACMLPWIHFVYKSLTAWIALFSLAFLCTYCAYYLYYLGLKYLEATRASISATLEPVMAAVVAFFWWKEYFTFMGYFGSALIISAVIIMIRDNPHHTTASEKETLSD